MAGTNSRVKGGQAESMSQLKEGTKPLHPTCGPSRSQETRGRMARWHFLGRVKSPTRDAVPTIMQTAVMRLAYFLHLGPMTSREFRRGPWFPASKSPCLKVRKRQLRARRSYFLKAVEGRNLGENRWPNSEDSITQ
jgi:hypothetical protein